MTALLTSCTKQQAGNIFEYTGALQSLMQCHCFKMVANLIEHYFETTFKIVLKAGTKAAGVPVSKSARGAHGDSFILTFLQIVTANDILCKQFNDIIIKVLRAVHKNMS